MIDTAIGLGLGSSFLDRLDAIFFAFLLTCQYRERQASPYTTLSPDQKLRSCMRPSKGKQPPPGLRIEFKTSPLKQPAKRKSHRRPRLLPVKEIERNGVKAEKIKQKLSENFKILTWDDNPEGDEAASKLEAEAKKPPALAVDAEIEQKLEALREKFYKMMDDCHGPVPGFLDKIGLGEYKKKIIDEMKITSLKELRLRAEEVDMKQEHRAKLKRQLKTPEGGAPGSENCSEDSFEGPTFEESLEPHRGGTSADVKGQEMGLGLQTSAGSGQAANPEFTAFVQDTASQGQVKVKASEGAPQPSGPVVEPNEPLGGHFGQTQSAWSDLGENAGFSFQPESSGESSSFWIAPDSKDSWNKEVSGQHGNEALGFGGQSEAEKDVSTEFSAAAPFESFSLGPSNPEPSPGGQASQADDTGNKDASETSDDDDDDEYGGFGATFSMNLGSASDLKSEAVIDQNNCKGGEEEPKATGGNGFELGKSETFTEPSGNFGSGGFQNFDAAAGFGAWGNGAEDTPNPGDAESPSGGLSGFGEEPAPFQDTAQRNVKEMQSSSTRGTSDLKFEASLDGESLFGSKTTATSSAGAVTSPAREAESKLLEQPFDASAGESEDNTALKSNDGSEVTRSPLEEVQKGFGREIKADDRESPRKEEKHQSPMDLNRLAAGVIQKDAARNELHPPGWVQSESQTDAPENSQGFVVEKPSPDVTIGVDSGQETEPPNPTNADTPKDAKDEGRIVHGGPVAEFLDEIRLGEYKEKIIGEMKMTSLEKLKLRAEEVDMKKGHRVKLKRQLEKLKDPPKTENLFEEGFQEPTFGKSFEPTFGASAEPMGQMMGSGMQTSMGSGNDKTIFGESSSLQGSFSAFTTGGENDFGFAWGDETEKKGLNLSWGDDSKAASSGGFAWGTQEQTSQGSSRNGAWSSGFDQASSGASGFGASGFGASGFAALGSDTKGFAWGNGPSETSEFKLDSGGEFTSHRGGNGDDDYDSD